MTFNDIFKSNFLENVNSVSIVDMVIAMVLAFIIGLFIFMVYKKTFSGVMYSAGFGVTLIVLTMVTTFVILAVTSNVVLSLGMVGALSIVRFRTAIKDPLDIGFLFWALASGVVLAAGMIPLAVFGSVLIGVVLIVFCNKKPAECPFIAIISCARGESERKVEEILSAQVKKFVIKSKTVTAERCELNYEIRLKDNSTDFIDVLVETEGVDSAVLVSYNGDYMN